MNRVKLAVGVVIIIGIIAVAAVHQFGRRNLPPTAEADRVSIPAADPAEDNKPKPAEEAAEPTSDSEQPEASSSEEKADDEAVDEPVDEAVDDSSAPEDPNEQTDAADDDPLEKINLNNVEMKQIIQKIAEWTGKPVIPYDDQVMGQKITIYATEELPRSQALSLIYAALRAKGYAPEEAQGAIYLKPLSQAKYGVVPTLGINEPLAKIADKSQIVEKFFKIQNYTPSKLQEIVAPLTAEYGHVTADDNTRTLAVIDTVENLQRVEQIISQFDVAEYGQSTTEVFKLQNGDPSEIVQIIELIISNRSGGRGRSSSRNRGRSSQDESQASSVLIPSETVPLLLIPEPRRKWIIAKGSTEDVKEVAKWIAELDKKDKITSEQTVVQIKYVDVMEVTQAVGRTLAEMPGSQLRANIVVQPLRQARQIVIFGSEENRKIVEGLIAEIDLPSSGIFDERTFELKHADPDQIKQNIDELYGEDQSNARYNYYYYSRQTQRSSDTVKVISYPTAGKITVIASPENLEKIAQQIEEWDVPLDIKRQPYRILTLQNSDPKLMAELLSTLFSEETEATRPNWWYLEGGTDARKKIVGSLYGQLSFEAVPETKKIIVISKIPEAYDVVERLVEELDRQEMAEVPRVITLKYADSEDLCDQLNAILNEPGTVATVRRSQRGLSDYSLEAESTEDNNQNRRNNGTPGNNANPDEIRPWWNAGVARNRAEEALPTSNLIGKVRFIPVQRSKALLVLAPPEYMDEMVTMIEELDQPGKQVMIKAVILSVEHNRVTSLGVQFGSNPAAFGDLSENAVLALTELTTGFERGSFTLAASSDINVLVEFLEKHANARILNQPTLWTKDNEEAVFFRGQRVAFVENINTSAEGTRTSQNVVYRPVGVTLRVRPNITPEKAVDTTINVNISQVLPEIINNNIATSDLDTTTHVIVQDGETIMLGGILYQNDSEIVRKVPLLGDIPLIGEVFKNTQIMLTNNELLMFITPYVVENTHTMQEAKNKIPLVNKGFRTLEEASEVIESKIMQLDATVDHDDLEMID